MRNFTGNASHQLRTPMAIIRTQLALAARAPTIDAARQAAQHGDNAVAHAERVLSQMLLLARIDAADTEQQAAFETLDLTAVARERTAEHVMRAHDEQVDLGFDGNLPCLVQGDRLLVEEAIDNLIANAIAYAGAGAEATVSVFTDGDVVLKVEDNGPGLSSQDRSRVLQRFARNSSKAGAGLGLPIVEEIARLFGARLELADGRDGRGLSVIMRFPAKAPGNDGATEVPSGTGAPGSIF
jgi:two-component system sensor histidine kinase TctE